MIDRAMGGSRQQKALSLFSLDTDKGPVLRYARKMLCGSNNTHDKGTSTYWVIKFVLRLMSEGELVP